MGNFKKGVKLLFLQWHKFRRKMLKVNMLTSLKFQMELYQM